MFKKILSALLAVMMLVSVLSVAVVTSGAAEVPVASIGDLDEETLYFDSSTTGWEFGAKSKVAFYIFGGDFDDVDHKNLPWGSKKALGTAVAGMDGVISFKPSAKGLTLNEGVQYKIIFGFSTGGTGAIDGGQTYDLFFTTDCLGKVAYCDGTEYENPVDSSKKALAAYWRDMDSSEYGPVLAISSIGNVVGTCPENGKTPYDILVEFFTEEKDDFQGKTGYQNAHKYKCEIDPTSLGYKTEQQLIDDIGAGLGLTKDDVKTALEEDDVVAKLEELPCGWSYDDSTLPAGQSGHTHTPGEPVIENDHASTCTVQGSYDEVIYCTECKEEISRETKYHDLAPHTAGDPTIENDHASTCTVQGSYDEVTYCTVCKGEISRETKYHDLAPHTAGDPVIENDHASTCTVKGAYDEVTYCTVCKGEISRETKYHDLAQHTAGEPEQDMMAGYPATCTEDGLKVMVTRCTECGEELDRQDVTIKAEGHKLNFVPEVPATATKDGVKAHYACENCDKLFVDADGTQEVTAESLVIPAQFVRGDVNNDGTFDANDVTTLQRVLVELDVPVYNEVVADVTGDGVIDARDVTLMQRVIVKMTTWEAWDAKHQPT